MIRADHLLDLAREEAGSQAIGAPRQAVLRRSVSTAYYALFHELLSTVATSFVPANQWKSRVLFYRALDHGRTRDRCKRLGKDPLPDEERAFFEIQSFPRDIRFFANEFVRLQELRHQSDYDPDTRLARQEVQDAIDGAEQAIGTLRAAGNDIFLLPFLSYVLFGLRR